MLATIQPFVLTHIILGKPLENGAFLSDTENVGSC
jgi:hypothetical protein